MNQLAAHRETATRTVIVIFILILLAFLFLDYNNRATQYSRLLTERERVASQKSFRQQTQSALQTEISYATSVPAVRGYGYENRKYQDGDIPVIIVNPAHSTPTPVPTASPRTEETSNLGSWLSLIINYP
jgi:hypothetical protein